MAIVPVYCPEDTGGPVSKARALELLRLMHQKHIAESAKNQSIPNGETESEHLTRTRAFDYHCGHEQALAWATGLVERVFVDPNPSASRRTLLKAAEKLEQQADSLRTVASYMEERREGQAG